MAEDFVAVFSSPRLARAFNRGCDDRIAGRSVADCPYQDYQEAQHWTRGWNDVNKNWGVDASGRWCFMRLPLAYTGGMSGGAA